MKLIITILFSAFTFLLIAQNSSDRDVPEIVEKNFKKKFPRAENISWDKVVDNYKVDCYYRGRATYAEYTPEGEWIQTVTDMDTKNIYPPIARYINENHKKDKVILIEKAVRADKQNFYYVQVSHKERGIKYPYIYELFFDKTGKIEQVKVPEGLEDQTIVGIDDPNTDTPAEVIDGWQKRFPKAEGIEWTKEINPSDSIDYNYIASFIYRGQVTKAEFLPNGKWVESRVEYEEKNLYVPVLKYIEENHWYDDLIIAEKVTRADRKDYYYVKMERQEKGQFRPYVFELFFDKSGKITKVIRPEELKSQYLLTVDIPPAVAKKFKSRFSSAKDVKWETSEGNWKSSFTYRDHPTTAEFSDSAQWIMTIVELDTKNLYAPVQRYIDKEFPKYKVMFAEKATRKDRKDYYYVELISNKKGIQPQQMGLYFDKTGKLKKEE